MHKTHINMICSYFFVYNDTHQSLIRQYLLIFILNSFIFGLLIQFFIEPIFFNFGIEMFFVFS